MSLLNDLVRVVSSAEHKIVGQPIQKASIAPTPQPASAYWQETFPQLPGDKPIPGVKPTNGIVPTANQSVVNQFYQQFTRPSIVQPPSFSRMSDMRNILGSSGPIAAGTGDPTVIHTPQDNNYLGAPLMARQPQGNVFGRGMANY